MDKVYEITLLFDFYGELLTEKQKNVIELYYLNDLSLFEIAEQCNISRQAVLDMIKRTEKLLRQYEEKLKLVRIYLVRKEKLKYIDKQFEGIIRNPSADGLTALRKQVAAILD